MLGRSVTVVGEFEETSAYEIEQLFTRRWMFLVETQGVLPDNLFLSLVAGAILLAFSHAFVYKPLKEYLEGRNEKKNTINHIKNTLQKHEIEIERQKMKKAALAQASIQSEKHWASKKDSIEIDEAYLNELLKLINDEEEAETPLIKNNEVDEPTEVEVSDQASKKSIIRKPKFPRQIQPSILRFTSSDKILKWGEHLPSYNLTQNSSVDPGQLVYRLSSGNRFVFVNRLLKKYLEINDPDALKALNKICERGKDHLPNHSKGERGFIIREEGNEKKLDKGVESSLIQEESTNKNGRKSRKNVAHKSAAISHVNNNNNNNNNNNQKFYIKAKAKIDPRFFGESVANKKDENKKARFLFEINGYKAHHKDKTIQYFPSEARMPLLKK